MVYELNSAHTGKPKNKKKDQKSSPNRRTVSFPPMFATIVEKVEEEEKQGREFESLPPSPMTDFYYALTLKGRQSWPTFVGDWAFVNGGHSHKRRSKLFIFSYLVLLLLWIIHRCRRLTIERLSLV